MVYSALLAKTEGSFSEDVAPHLGHVARSEAWLIGRICSNSLPHESHQYS
jgi:hypothetical protein